MKFPKKTLRLISVKTIEKEGKKYTFVKLADESTFENNDFMLSRETDGTKLTANSRYDVELDVDGKFTTVSLWPVKTA